MKTFLFYPFQNKDSTNCQHKTYYILNVRGSMAEGDVDSEKEAAAAEPTRVV